MKKVIGMGAIVFALPVFLLLLTLIGNAGGVTPVAPVSTQEKIEEYAITASKLGAPWDIVILTDAIAAQAQGQSGIEDKNPVGTALEFLLLDVTKECWSVVNSYYDEEKEEWQYEYDWVYENTVRYTAKAEILRFCSVSEEEIASISPEGFLDLVRAAAASYSTSLVRYTTDFSPNVNYQEVMRLYIALPEETIVNILELYDAAYLDTWLTEQMQARIKDIRAQYGMYQYLDGLEGYINCEGLVFSHGDMQVVYFNQLDSRWKNSPYGSDHIGGYGCGPTAMAIVISSLTDGTYDPVYMANWAFQNGFWAKGSGSYHSLIPRSAQAFGLSVSGCTQNEPQRVLDALSQGRLVVALMAKGHFTTGGHFIVLRGVTADGKILVADPASVKNSEKSWDASIIFNEARKGSGAGGPFWIIS